MKKPIFKSKSIPGLSKEELNKLSNAKLASSEVGKQNVESGHLESIRPKALEAYVNGEYFHSETHRKSLAKGGVASSVVNLKKGNIGKDSKMSRYKKDRNRKRWAHAILPQGSTKFLAGDIKKYISNKVWYNVVNSSDFVIKLDEKGGYHNTHNYYTLNLENIQKYIDMPEPKFEDY